MTYVNNDVVHTYEKPNIVDYSKICSNFRKCQIKLNSKQSGTVSLVNIETNEKKIYLLIYQKKRKQKRK